MIVGLDGSNEAVSQGCAFWGLENMELIFNSNIPSPPTTFSPLPSSLFPYLPWSSPIKSK